MFLLDPSKITGTNRRQRKGEREREKEGKQVRRGRSEGRKTGRERQKGRRGENRLREEKGLCNYAVWRINLDSIVNKYIDRTRRSRNNKASTLTQFFKLCKTAF